MSRRITMETLVALVDGDRQFVALLIEEGVIEAAEESFGPEAVDRVLASRTLIQELGVNIAGVDIILRLRRELAQARSRLASIEGGEE